MKRCNCPHYHVPDAGPAYGCPVHDPNYVDPDETISKLETKVKRLDTKNKKLKLELGIAKGQIERLSSAIEGESAAYQAGYEDAMSDVAQNQIPNEYSDYF